MTVLILGAGGMLGQDLLAECRSRGWNACAATRTEVDLTTTFEIQDLTQYDAVFNCAAYTAVDRAESEPELAHQINAAGTARLAELCQAASVPLLHFSTDYVFDGTKTEPYAEDDPVNPQSVYGKSKLAGEQAALRAGATVLRTAWLFGSHGHCFPRSILRAWLAGKPVRVVSDQWGNPTYTPDLAWVAAEVAAKGLWGELFHAVSPDAMTWHEFASRVVRAYAAEHGLPEPDPLAAISTQDWPTPAPRPAYSVLSTAKLGRAGIQWPRGIEAAISHFVCHVQGIRDV